MFADRKKSRLFFEGLCVDYYEKILRYLRCALGDESAAKDCVQDVFLVACQKAGALMSHPNPGGFLFLTAKNLAQKSRRESFRRMQAELPADDGTPGMADPGAEMDRALDSQIDENEYIEAVLSRLSDEKRGLYSLYYHGGKTMAEAAAELGIEEAAVRMRYVRLRREIRRIAAAVAEENFYL